MPETICIYCKNNDSFFDVPVGSSLLEIYELAGAPLPRRPMNALVNNKVEGLIYRCWRPRDVEFADYTRQSGLRTYVRSLCLIFLKAVNDVLPSATLNLEHPVSRGYYCTIHNGKPVDRETTERIKARMQEIVDADLPFRYHTLRTPEAVGLFRRRGMEDKAQLLETAGLSYTSFHELDGYFNVFYGCLTPSSGFIHLFDIAPYAEGVLLRIPRKDAPGLLEPVVRQDKMFDVYKESLKLKRALGLNHAGDLNRAVAEGHVSQIVLAAEAMQEKQIAKTAEQIALRYPEGVRAVLISGPSSSGKTTFAQRLGIQLLTNLLHPVRLSLDDYFLNRRDTPRDPEGEYDFESLYALDLDYFNRDLQKLLQGETIDLPTYDFTTGLRLYKGKRLQLKENSLLVVEGIHALNPELTARVSEAQKYRVYVSALTSISIDNHNWIPTTDNRLLRRIIRDCHFRNYSARETIARWPSVRRGEEKWIFPYQETADAMFNSAMLYELAALRRFAEPLLGEIREADAEYAEAYRLGRFLKYFNPISDRELPATSLLREFLGGGSFQY
jgi:uridine kinase